MYCSKCGRKLSDDAKFCDACGAQVDEVSHSENIKKDSYKDGDVFKCPYCGEILPFDAIKCPTCGRELRGKDAARSVEKFSDKLESCENQTKKLDLIRNYPIPNSREDIMEFMLLASTNYYSPINSGERRADELSAWRIKMDQCHMKAHMLLKDPSDLEQIDCLYYGKKINTNKVTSTSSNNNVSSKKSGVSLRVAGVIFTIICSLFFVLGFSLLILDPSDISSNSTRFALNPSLLDDSSALDSEKNFTYVSQTKGSFYVSVKFSSEYNAELGNYVEQDYIYHAFGGTTNTFTATVDVYSAEIDEIYTNYYSLNIDIRKGDKTYNSDLPYERYSRKGSVITYSYEGDIYIYSIDITINKNPPSPKTTTGIVFIVLSFILFLPPAIFFNIGASIMNKRYKREIGRKSLGREKYFRQQEEIEKRREKERLERENKNNTDVKKEN